VIDREIDKSYRKKVWLFSILGYVYIAAVVLAVTAAAALLVFSAVEIHSGYAVVKASLALAVFLFIILKSLWVKFEKPAGLEVSAKDVPELASFISEIRAKVGGPMDYKLLLTEDMNASIVQHPRLGILGYYQNYVIVGMPLLMTVSAEELKSVLAHEFGHLKETHGIWAAKIYRNISVWVQIMENLEARDHWGTFLFKGFFKWYLPRLDEYSMSMRREHEYEADREAVRVAGRDVFGEFMLKFDINADRINIFWRETFRKMQTSPEPANGIFEEMQRFLGEPVDAGYQQRIILRELKAAADDGDTHPSLSERLSAVGYDPASFKMSESNAADLLLGENRTELISALSSKWKEEISQYWKYKYDELQQQQDDLKELEKAEKTENNLLLKARILEELDREKEALEKYEELLGMNPENLEALFSKGKILISEENTGEEGKEILDRVMEEDGEYSYYGTQLVYKYLLRQGRKEESRAYYDTGMKEAHRLDEAVEERGVVKLKDSFVPHGLSAEQLDNIIDQLKKREKIKEVYLVRKEVKHYSEEPLYILGVLFKSSSKKFMANALEEIAENVVFPAETLVMMFNEENPGFYRKHKRVENSLILKNS